nr:small multi-drug export protein [Methanobacterium alcaliphilum]
MWIAIPAGFAFQLNPAATAAASALGASASAMLVLFFGEKLRTTILEKYHPSPFGKRTRLIHKIWEKYGLIGLGLLSPLLFGAPIGAAIGAALGSSRPRLMFWMVVGIIIWSAGLTIAAMEGIKISQMI